MAVQTTTPNSGALSTFQNQNFLTSSDLLQIHATAAESVDTKLFGRYGKEQLGIMPLIEKFGRKEAATAQRYGHYETDRTREIIRVTNSYSSGGVTATFTVASTTPDYVYSYPSAASETWYTNYTAQNMIPVRQYDVLELSGGVRVSVTSVNYSTNQFSVECMSDGETVPAGLENVEIWNVTRAKPEGSSSGVGRSSRLIRYTNFIQTIDETYTASGAAMGTKSPLRNLAGSDYWYIQDVLNTRTNFDAITELAMFVGKITTSTTSTFNSTFTTEGMITSVENYGNVEAYTINSFGLTDLQNLINTLKAQYAPNEYMLISSQNFAFEWDLAFRTLNGMTAGGINYDQDMIQLGFNGVEHGGVKFYKKTLQGFSDNKTLGSANSSYKNLAVAIPMGTVTSFDEGKQEVQKPAFVYKYLNVDGEVEGMYENITGGAGMAKTNTTDSITYTMRRRCGTETYGLAQWGLFQGE